MTWKQLKAHIEVMDEEQANTDATIYLKNTDEYLPVEDIEFADTSVMVLDRLHPYLIIDF